MSVSFKAIKPRSWQGRYSRVQGNESVLHLSTHDGRLWPVIVWYVDDGKLICAAETSKATCDLAESVISGKRYLGGAGTGSFQINEFGQVIVPASDGSGRRAIVGEISGSIQFRNPETKLMFDFSGANLKCGDLWPLPYVGMKYNLHTMSKIYFYRQGANGAQSEYPNNQDKTLVAALRSIRRTGAVRFIVNMCGVVLTRRPPAGPWGEEEHWEPVYVGRINVNKWFHKEE